MIPANRKFYLISFAEGASVMVAELVGAKLLSPYFGSSLYVWSAVMAVTLGGLAMGYFLGGRLSAGKNVERNLFYVLAGSGISMIMMPFLAKWVFPIAFSMGLLISVIICSSVVLLIPVFLMGTVSPLIIKMLTTDSNESGKRAGEVYAVSTAGGIIATFLTGFWLVPQFGLIKPLITFGFIMLIVSLMFFIRYRKYIFTLIVLVTSVLFSKWSLESAYKDESVIFSSDGLLGRVEVLHYERPMDSIGTIRKERVLLINNVIQTWIDESNGNSLLEYIDVFRNNLNQFHSSPKKALILGLGGGVAARLLSDSGWEVTAIELDERIANVSRNYFNLPEKVKVIVDDARHGLKDAGNGYSLVLFDMYSAEVAPSHVVSVEALKQLESLCNNDVVFIFNTYGYLSQPTGKGNLSLLKTLSTLNFENRICTLGDTLNEDYRGLLIYSYKNNKPDSSLYHQYFKDVDFQNASVIRDEDPVLEFQNALAAKRWRHAYIRNYISTRY